MSTQYSVLIDLAARAGRESVRSVRFVHFLCFAERIRGYEVRLQSLSEVNEVNEEINTERDNEWKTHGYIKNRKHVLK